MTDGLTTLAMNTEAVSLGGLEAVSVLMLITQAGSIGSAGAAEVDVVTRVVLGVDCSNPARWDAQASAVRVDDLEVATEGWELHHRKQIPEHFGHDMRRQQRATRLRDQSRAKWQRAKRRERSSSNNNKSKETTS